MFFKVFRRLKFLAPLPLWRLCALQGLCVPATVVNTSLSVAFKFHLRVFCPVIFNHLTRIHYCFYSDIFCPFLKAILFLHFKYGYHAQLWLIFLFVFFEIHLRYILPCDF